MDTALIKTESIISKNGNCPDFETLAFIRHVQICNSDHAELDPAEAAMSPMNAT